MGELMLCSWGYIGRWVGDDGFESEDDGRDVRGLEVLGDGGGRKERD